MKRNWYCEVRHPQLNKFRRIVGYSKAEVEEKADAQLAIWEEQWQRKRQAAAKRNKTERRKQNQERSLKEAKTLTDEAVEAFSALERLLIDRISQSIEFDWETLKNTEPFSEPKPRRPNRKKLDEEPKESDFQPSISLFDHIFSSSKARKVEDAKSHYDAAHKRWLDEKNRIDEINAVGDQAHRDVIDKWQEAKQQYEEEQSEHNNFIDEMSEAYKRFNKTATEMLFDALLNQSPYPENLNVNSATNYDAEQKLLVVDCELPNLEMMPSLKQVKFVKTRNEFTESHHSQAAVKKLFDSACYQICLRTLYEVFSADAVNAIDVIVFNGWVQAVDTGTGNDVRNCIMTVQVSKPEFRDINLEKVDPKDCFRRLKGVAAATLHNIAPVAPLIMIDRDDSRFVQGVRSVDIDQSTNLAAMDWEDFEHLIRDLFEKEFGAHGGEVKVTRASKDGGVDAVIFDPDPIKGGKLVIQAKRYTNTVDVSAVRDLYGTLMNEGAMKGILVTTSTYGPDAYKFAADKPISLIDGGNFLNLLQKHGQKARIDIAEAKTLMN